MIRSLTQLISRSLLLPNDAMVYEISHRLADLFPNAYVLETEDYNFDPVLYAEEGRCSLHPLEATHAQLEASWNARERKIDMEPRNAFYEVLWRGKRLHCLSVTYGDCDSSRYYILADTMEDARVFFSAVCAFNGEVHDEIMVYRGNGFKRDKALMAQIKGASLDNLVLPGSLREELISDIEGFFSAKDLYHRHGVAWKRGVLLLGPPGNGKTHCIKAMINRMGKPCLYIRTFKPSRGTVHQSMEFVFAEARAIAPCVLILEDLDSLVGSADRSFLLNEMDGFAENEGILTIATTNHPDKLDPALLERPSRFDRKITFTLPAEAERRRFLAMMDERRDESARLTESDLEELARATDGFSFAYLKELGLSSLMIWVRNPTQGAMGDVMRSQVETLRSQMRTERPATRPAYEEEDDD